MNAHFASNRSLVEIGCIIDNNIVIASRHNREIHNAILEVLRREIVERNEIALRVQILRDLLRLCLELRQRRLLVSVLREHIRQLRLCHRILTRERIACNPNALLCILRRADRRGVHCHCCTGNNK